MAKAGGNKEIKVQPMLRIRVACEKCLKREEEAKKEKKKTKPPKPWLRRLYVLWAVPAGGEDEKAVYSLAQTDEEGYLSPVLNALDPKPKLTVPLFKGAAYRFYFVRYPTATVAQDLLALLDAEPEVVEEAFGSPHTIIPDVVGTEKLGGGTVTEGIVKVPEAAGAFIQDGSAFYGGWCLFRDMPGMGANLKDTDAQCPELGRQVRRLQYHLGRMRYPIGNQWHPYSPEPWSTAEERSYKKLPLPPAPLYQNEGVFDVVTWNCVLAFQRDAAAGKGVKLTDKTITATLSEGSFDPLPAAEDRVLEMVESGKFLAASGAGGVGKAEIDLPERRTIVDRATGDAIATWLKAGLRKPGAILVSRGTDKNSFDSWMRGEVYEKVAALHADLMRLGCVRDDGPEQAKKKDTRMRRRDGVQFNSTFRDTRMSVFEATKLPGQDVNSIHKSGFAFDMRMDNFVGPDTDAPLYFTPAESKNGRVRWTVYTPVRVGRIPVDAGAHAEYVDAIRPWKYDSESETGGELGEELRIDGCRFLNFTKVCVHHGFCPIKAWATGWQRQEALEFTISDAESFRKFVNRLDTDVKRASEEKWTHGEPEVELGGRRFTAKSLAELRTALKTWLTAMEKFAPTPEISVEPWTKEGEKAHGQLRSEALSGMPARVTLFYDLDSVAGAADGKLEKVAELEVTLGPEFVMARGTAYTITPTPGPVEITKGMKCILPGLGMPQAMEWWHFNYMAGYGKPVVGKNCETQDRKKWVTLLEEIGWTREGLLGVAWVQVKGSKKGVPKPFAPIHGQWGLGYLPSHLDVEAD